MVKEIKSQLSKIAEISIKQAPALTVLVAVVFGLTYLHNRQLDQLRTDFINAAAELNRVTTLSTARSIEKAAEGAKEQADALRGIAKAFEKHSEVQLRSDANMEALIREISRLSIKNNSGDK